MGSADEIGFSPDDWFLAPSLLLIYRFAFYKFNKSVLNKLYTH